MASPLEMMVPPEQGSLPFSCRLRRQTAAADGAVAGVQQESAQQPREMTDRLWMGFSEERIDHARPRGIDGGDCGGACCTRGLLELLVELEALRG
jgi:hypothetical protein